MTATHPRIGIIVGSSSDLSHLGPALEFLETSAVPYQLIIASAHRTPEEVSQWVESASERGIEVIIAAAGGAAHLPGVVASQTLLPVIGLPIDSSPLAGTDSLYSIVQMPPGIPVATVGINAGLNAALLAVHILARVDRSWEPVLRNYRDGWKAKIQSQNEAFEKERPLAIPWKVGRPTVASPEAALPPEFSGRVPLVEERNPVTGPTVNAGGIPTASMPPADDGLPHTAKPGLIREAQYVGRIRVDSELLPIDVAENATDCLLDGGIVALPTDTVYGLAVDATNPAAVGALCDLKGRDADKPIAIFIESQKQLTALVKDMSGEVRRMLEAFWPGPLTVVFERRSRDFDYLAPGTTIGVRLPDHSVALALLQELRRPIACSSANPSGAPPARSGEEVEQYFGRDVQMILDAGKLPSADASTVIDVSRQPFRLIREGPISRAQLSAVLGDLLESDETE